MVTSIDSGEDVQNASDVACSFEGRADGVRALLDIDVQASKVGAFDLPLTGGNAKMVARYASGALRFIVVRLDFVKFPQVELNPAVWELGDHVRKMVTEENLVIQVRATSVNILPCRSVDAH